MRARATDSAVDDAWHGARVAHRARLETHRRMSSMGAEIDLGEPGQPLVTVLLLALSTAATFVEFGKFGTHPTTADLDSIGAGSAFALARGDWWSMLTANLLHGSVGHLAVNAFAIFLVGRWLEHLVGRAVLVAVMVWAAIGSSVGALLLSPDTVTIGASGIAFGMFGAALVVDRRGRTTVGLLGRTFTIVGVIGTFATPDVSIGGHAGGLVLGAIAAWACWSTAEQEGAPVGRARRAGTAIVLVAGLAVMLVLAGVQQVAPDRAQSRGRDVAGRLLER